MGAIFKTAGVAVLPTLFLSIFLSTCLVFGETNIVEATKFTTHHMKNFDSCFDKGAKLCHLVTRDASQRCPTGYIGPVLFCKSAAHYKERAKNNLEKLEKSLLNIQTLAQSSHELSLTAIRARLNGFANYGIYEPETLRDFALGDSFTPPKAGGVLPLDQFHERVNKAEEAANALIKSIDDYYNKMNRQRLTAPGESNLVEKPWRDYETGFQNHGVNDVNLKKLADFATKLPYSETRFSRGRDRDQHKDLAAKIKKSSDALLRALDEIKAIQNFRPQEIPSTAYDSISDEPKCYFSQKGNVAKSKGTLTLQGQKFVFLGDSEPSQNAIGALRPETLSTLAASSQEHGGALYLLSGMTSCRGTQIIPGATPKMKPLEVFPAEEDPMDESAP